MQRAQLLHDLIRDRRQWSLHECASCTRDATRASLLHDANAALDSASLDVVHWSCVRRRLRWIHGVNRSIRNDSSRSFSERSSCSGRSD